MDDTEKKESTKVPTLTATYKGSHAIGATVYAFNKGDKFKVHDDKHLAILKNLFR